MLNSPLRKRAVHGTQQTHTLDHPLRSFLSVGLAGNASVIGNTHLLVRGKERSVCMKFSATIVIILMVLISNTSYAESHGQFKNMVKCEWPVDEEGPYRDVRLLEDFFYIDTIGKTLACVEKVGS